MLYQNKTRPPHHRCSVFRGKVTQNYIGATSAPPHLYIYLELTHGPSPLFLYPYDPPMH